jgi:hypothetical protein
VPTMRRDERGPGVAAGRITGSACRSRTLSMCRSGGKGLAVSEDQSAPWDAPAHIWGLPITSWKKRTGYELHGTLAQCIARWLDLPGYQQQECQLSCFEAGKGIWEPRRIGAYVVKHGLPPQVVAARGGVQPSKERLAEIVSMPVHTPASQSKDPSSSTPGTSLDQWQAVQARGRPPQKS